MKVLLRVRLRVALSGAKGVVVLHVTSGSPVVGAERRGSSSTPPPRFLGLCFSSGSRRSPGEPLRRSTMSRETVFAPR